MSNVSRLFPAEHYVVCVRVTLQLPGIQLEPCLAFGPFMKECNAAEWSAKLVDYNAERCASAPLEIEDLLSSELAHALPHTPPHILECFTTAFRSTRESRAAIIPPDDPQATESLLGFYAIGLVHEATGIVLETHYPNM